MNGEIKYYINNIISSLDHIKYYIVCCYNNNDNIKLNKFPNIKTMPKLEEDINLVNYVNWLNEQIEDLKKFVKNNNTTLKLNDIEKSIDEYYKTNKSDILDKAVPNNIQIFSDFKKELIHFLNNLLK